MVQRLYERLVQADELRKKADEDLTNAKSEVENFRMKIPTCGNILVKYQSKRDSRTVQNPFLNSKIGNNNES